MSMNEYGEIVRGGGTPKTNKNQNNRNNGGGRLNPWFSFFIIVMVVYLIIASPSTSSSYSAEYTNPGSQSYANVLVDYKLYKDGHGIADYDYVIADSDRRRLTSEDTDKLTLRGINYAKNELYARHGRKFEASELQSFFGSRTWYYGYMDASVESDWAIQRDFNQYEEYNKNLLRDLEESMGMYELH